LKPGGTLVCTELPEPQPIETAKLTTTAKNVACLILAS
jgi:hypothetical protein